METRDLYVYGGNHPHFHSGQSYYVRRALEACRLLPDSIRVLPINYIRTRRMPVTALRYLASHGGRLGGFLFSDSYHDKCLRHARTSVADGSILVASVQNIGSVGRWLVREKSIELYFYIDATLMEYWPPSDDMEIKELQEKTYEKERLSYGLAKGFFVYHEGVSQSLEHDYGIAKEKIRVVGRGVNILDEQVQAARDQPGGHADVNSECPAPLTLMTVGKDAVRKGVFKVIEAIDELPPDLRQRLRYVVAGPHPSKLPAREFIEPLGFVSARDRQRLLTRMRQADLGVLLSDWDSLAGSVHEFLALGTPCWMSELPNHERLLRNPGVIPQAMPIDVESVKSRLVDLLTTPDMLRAARAAAEAQWDTLTWAPVVESMAEIMAPNDQGPA